MTRMAVTWLYALPGRGICDVCDAPLAVPVAEVHGYKLKLDVHDDLPVPFRPLVMDGPFVLCPGCQKAVGIAPGDDQVELARLERQHQWARGLFFPREDIAGELLRLEVVQE